MKASRWELVYGAFRACMGTALALTPRLPGRVWLGPGADSEAAAVPLRSLGLTDASIGLGTLWAIRKGRPVEPWLEAAVASDFGDLIASLADRRRIRTAGGALVALFALGGMAAGILILRVRRTT
jgi:hypothetical protein